MTDTDRYLTGLLVAASCVGLLSSPASGQDEHLRGQVQTRILQRCTVTMPSEQEPAASVVLGQDAVPYIIEAFESGPPAPQVNDMRTSARRRFESIRRLIATGADLGLAAADLQRLRDMSPADYINSAVSDFVFAFEDAALRVAADVGGPDSERFLRRVADGETVHAATASELLNRQGR